jgi:hypothetical protein
VAIFALKGRNVAGSESQSGEPKVTYIIQAQDLGRDLKVGDTMKLTYELKREPRDDDSDLDEPAEIWVAEQPVVAIGPDPENPGSTLVYFGTGKWVKVPGK